MPRLFCLLFLAFLASGCKFSAADLPNLLNAYELPERSVTLPKSWDKLVAGQNPVALAYYEKLQAFAQTMGVTVVESPLNHESVFGRSLFGPHVIQINSEMGPDAKLDTLIHELAHFCSFGSYVTQTEGEVIAEGVTLLVVGQMKDLEYLVPYSLVYLLNVANEKPRTALIKSHASVIDGCANDIKGALLE